jgi:hypothetical protein
VIIKLVQCLCLRITTYKNHYLVRLYLMIIFIKLKQHLVVMMMILIMLKYIRYIMFEMVLYILA